MAVPNIFGNATSSIPLSQLDTNFATAITLGNTAVYLGNTTTTLSNLSLANVTVSSAATPISEAAGGTGSNSGWNDFKNRIINGGMVIDQRNAGASQTITAAAALAYTVDRWYAYCTGANVTGQQIAGAYTSSQYRYQFTGAASVTAIGFGQRIEAKNCFDLANTTATLSCYISNSLLTTVTWTAYYATTTADTFGSLASPTVTQIATGTFTVSSTRTQYTTNISIPSAATTGIQILFTVGAQTSGTWIIDSVQLEKGSTATSFDYRPYGTELALCQRYYAQVGGGGNCVFGTSLQMSSGNNYFSIPTKVPMRTTPSFSSTSTFQILNSADNPMTISAGPTLRVASSDFVSFTFTTSAGATTGNASIGQFATSTSSFNFSAEL